ncbi:MAG: SLBB domain-containing protein [Acidobacteriota bacterium]|nr:SLBB domain-containing protein [Acidobacteriota bacterium]
MNKKIWLSGVLTLALAQIAFGQQTTAVQSPPDPVSNEAGYVIGVGDEISGKVSNEKDFDFVGDVDEDGKLQIPFADEPIQASCRTEKQLRADVTRLLAKYLRNPQISVRVSQRRSHPPAVIFGEVRTPQQVDLRRQARLLDMLSLAGGVTEQAGGTIQLYHTQQRSCSAPAVDKNSPTDVVADLDSPPKIYSLNSLREGRDDANPIIFPGDKIIVDKASPVYITGEVNAPQGILLKEGGTTLTDAIAKVNGVRREAKTKDIKIYRLKPNGSEQDNREIITVNYDAIKKGTQKDILLQPYDIIEVDKSKKSIGTIALELAVGATRTALSASAAGLPTTVLY